MQIVFGTLIFILGIGIIYSFAYESGRRAAWEEIKKDIEEGKIPWQDKWS